MDSTIKKLALALFILAGFSNVRAGNKFSFYVAGLIIHGWSVPMIIAGGLGWPIMQGLSCTSKSTNLSQQYALQAKLFLFCGIFGAAAAHLGSYMRKYK